MIVAGVDEAGRGPLAGPVVAAAVVLGRCETARLLSMGLRDSKALSAASREEIFAEMCRMDVDWRAQAASHRRIDRDNILAATLWAMNRSVTRLSVKPGLVIVDGPTPIPGLGIPQRALTRADEFVPSVAAASVVAKVLRDRVMGSLDRLFPCYGFRRHKGYATRGHVEALRLEGPCGVHRKSYHVRGWS
ncbi:MAG TPA: ribonuclease HII [Synergistales bacterium]|nr:ribonuclease HII [Synergistales bacterium]HPK43145.1 ribonuclease HII [Synergistales bacterium]